MSDDAPLPGDGSGDGPSGPRRRGKRPRAKPTSKLGMAVTAVLMLWLLYVLYGVLIRLWTS